ADRFGHAVELGGGRSRSRPGAPVIDMRRRGEEVALLRVAARVRDDQVLEAVVGVARPRDEVVHVRRLAGAAREALRAVEAPSLLELDDRPAHALERHALGAEEEALELVLVEAVQRRDLDRPLVMDQRAEEVVQPDERLPHAGAQVDAVVEGAALAALVAPDVRLPDGLRPVDRVEERDGLVADGLQAGQGHLDELPLDEVEQALVPRGGPCDRVGQRCRAARGAYPRENRGPTGSRAEVRGDEALRAKLPPGWYAWHSLRVQTRAGWCGEGDFIIAEPRRGLLVLEVKGGTVELRDGHWWQNELLMARGPRKQAFRLRRLLLERLADAHCEPPAHGIATCFPDAAFSAPPSQDDLAGT